MTPRLRALTAVTAVAMMVAACGRTHPRTTATAPPGVVEVREGLASFYGRAFNGRMTASGVRYNMREMVAAHPAYPFGTVLRVTNLRNHRSVRVRIVDRGPDRDAQADGVIVDLSLAAAQALGFVREGRARVRVEVLR